MKTNNEIVLAYIINNPEIEKTFNHLTNGSIWKEDLYSEIILYFLEMDNQKLNSIVSQGLGAWKGYFIQTIRNTLHSSSSPFYYKYRHRQEKKHVRFDSIQELEYFLDNDQSLMNSISESGSEKLQRIWKKIEKNLYWYDRELFNLYLEHYNSKRTLKDISEKTKIPYGAVAVTIQRIKQLLKKQIIKEFNKEEIKWKS